MTITRFAPSPTGYLHVGNIRTAVLNWLLARKTGGEFILRIDDTDPERSKETFVDQILRDLEWLGLTWDRLERQSDRIERYYGAAEYLADQDRLYECFETPVELDLKRKKQRAAGKPPVYDRAALHLSDADKAELRQTRNPHMRFLLDRTEITYADMIRGNQRIDGGSLSDPVLIRADGQVLYTLASVVDDIDMKITDVVRGADHITNTGLQIQLFSALGSDPPRFAHNSLLVGADGGPLSKRLGALAIKDIAAIGVEPVALLSMMARLGSSSPVEVATDISEVIDTFDISGFGTAPTRFDPEELNVHSAKTLRALPFDTVADRLGREGLPTEMAAAFWQAVGPNLDRFSEVTKWRDLCALGAAPVVAPDDAEFVAQALPLLPPRPWDETTWGTWTQAVKAATGRKGRGLFLPLRRLLTGQDHGPDMSALMPLLSGPIPNGQDS